ncbi:MAG: NAD+ synthase [Chloroflexota bacterium]
MRTLRIALAQMNPTVGAVRENADRIIALMAEAEAAGADIVGFPELALTGYPPEDLLFKRGFLAAAARELERIAGASAECVAVVGAPERVGESLYNGAALCHRGRVVDTYHKALLPNYGVFDERRYFEPGHLFPVYTVRGVQVGVNVCEDIWTQVGPTTVARAGGAEVIVNINASPYHRGKGAEREAMLAQRALEHGVAIAYANMVGGQDELVFDGGSLVLSPAGQVMARGPQFTEALVLADVDADATGPLRLASPAIEAQLAALGAPAHHTLSEEPAPARRPLPPALATPLDPLEEVYQALVLGTRDYVRKSGFPGALIGLSGGIDSALTAAIAADALGPDGVRTVFMPSMYTAGQSATDAAALAKALGIRMDTIAIKPLYEAFIKALSPLFEGRSPDTTEENIQARIRGNLLMALSNKLGWIVLTTGNKSEMATGYATLYGDMAGGFAVIKDVPKTLVFELCRHLNANRARPVIPEAIIARPPTAELRPDQKDEDSLPPYPLLDAILQAYVEEDHTVDEMLAAGHPPEAVARAVRLVDRSEYKRRQAPPGVKITRRNFGRDRRLPIVNRYQPPV